jgi:cytochrome c biogenesis factor
MTEIGYYSILFSLFLSAYCGLALTVGIKNRRLEVIASAENAATAVSVFLTLSVAAIVIYSLIRRWSASVQEAAGAPLDENQLSEYRERLENELRQFDESR